jgi:TPP-dependent pyruvate/acetoin dehydrogenase alpha subunit
MTTLTPSPPASPIVLPNPEGSYLLMLTIRRFEEAVHELFLQNLIHGTVHLGIGQEAIAVDIAATLRWSAGLRC